MSVILDLMPNAALLLDARGRITQANRAAETMLREGCDIARHHDIDPIVQ
jgi:PAS domain-containing protein